MELVIAAAVLASILGIIIWRNSSKERPDTQQGPSREPARQATTTRHEKVTSLQRIRWRNASEARKRLAIKKARDRGCNIATVDDFDALIEEPIFWLLYELFENISETEAEAYSFQEEAPRVQEVAVPQVEEPGPAVESHSEPSPAPARVVESPSCEPGSGGSSGESSSGGSSYESSPGGSSDFGSSSDSGSFD